MRLMLPFALVSLLAGCASPGACDPDDSHLDLVYDSQGVPAFAGQAMIIESCGSGGFCHSADDIPAEDRLGAPVGLNFDLRLATTGIETDLDSRARLGENQERVVGMRNDIWFQVSTGSMPPPGNEYRDRIAAGGLAGHAFLVGAVRTPLPDIASPEGREIVRNYLACDAPVIERTVEPRFEDPQRDPPVGFTAAACEQDCLDATWPAIQQDLLVASCAFGNCHDSTEPPVGLDFTGDSAAVHSRLVDAGRLPGIVGGQCGSRDDVVYIAAGDLDASFLYEKVTSPGCGALMPAAGNPLSAQRLCVLAAWIECGACADPNDAACAACVEGRRDACNVPAGGTDTRECRRPETDCASRL